MSELIDRKELLKCFCITKDGKRIPEVDCDNHEITISIKDIKRIIREQPTVDTRTPMTNIVEKLEERRIEYELSSENAPDDVSSTYRKGVMRGYEYSRDLVKQEINNGLE